MSHQGSQTSPTFVQKYLNPEWLSFFILLAMVVALNSSKAVLSIGMVVLAALAFWHGWNIRWKFDPPQKQRLILAAILAGIFLISLINGFWTANQNLWLRDVKTKLSILLIPLALGILPVLTLKRKFFLSIAFIFAQAVWGLITLLLFWQNYEAEMERVRHNGNIDIFGSISHIYFGLLLAFAIILGVYWIWKRKIDFPQWLWYLLIFATIINLLSLHVLSSRTAQLGFYLGLLVMIVSEISQGANFRKGLLLLSGLMMLPVVAYFSIPSFQKRVEVSWWDFNNYRHQKGIYKDNSISSRLITWEETFAIFTENPVLGIGLEDIGDTVERRYLERGIFSTVQPHLKIPHNLYLKYLAGVGVPGLLYLLLLLLYPLWVTRKRPQSLLWAFIALMAAGFMFENFLERQIGIAFFSIAYMLIPQTE